MDYKTQPIRARRRQSGMTMIELMSVLAVGAAVIVGGIIMFQEVSNRQQGNRILQGMTAFMVDSGAYMNIHRDDCDGDTNEDSGGYTATLDGTIDTNDPAGGATAPGACRVLQNRQFANMPSIRFGDETATTLGDYDDDALSEWALMINANEGLDIGFVLAPGANTDLDAAAGSAALAGGAAGTATTDIPCDAGDTSLFMAIAMPTNSVCQSIVGAAEGFQHVESAACRDVNELSGTAAFADNVDGEAALYLCFAHKP